MSSTPPSDQPTGFDVGVCTTGESRDIFWLVQSVFADARISEIPLRRAVVVASECPPKVIEQLSRIAEQEPRLDFVTERHRHGKAEAINQVLRRSHSEFLILVNSDAHPEPGAILELLRAIKADKETGIMSAKPVPEPGRGIASALADLMWTAHNECSLALNHMNLSNHCSDELVAMRRSIVIRLPSGLVNDGAYLATRARQRGYRVKFLDTARVHVEAPYRVADAIGQRRRILFGHHEVWRKTGAMPKTTESLILFSPGLGIRLLVRTLSKKPRFLVLLPLAVVAELTAAALSMLDSFISSKRHAVWRRYT